MTKIKEILMNNCQVSDFHSDDEGCIEFTAKQLDTAAAAIEKVHDEEMEKVIEWVLSSTTDFGGNHIYLKDGEYKDAAQLIHLYKNK